MYGVEAAGAAAWALALLVRARQRRSRYWQRHVHRGGQPCFCDMKLCRGQALEAYPNRASTLGWAVCLAPAVSACPGGLMARDQNEFYLDTSVQPEDITVSLYVSSDKSRPGTVVPLRRGRCEKLRGHPQPTISRQVTMVRVDLQLYDCPVNVMMAP